MDIKTKKVLDKHKKRVERLYAKIIKRHRKDTVQHIPLFSYARECFNCGLSTYFCRCYDETQK